MVQKTTRETPQLPIGPLLVPQKSKRGTPLIGSLRELRIKKKKHPLHCPRFWGALECDADWRMSGDWDEDMCKKALVLVEELCFRSGGYSQSASCQEFSYMMRGRNSQIDSGNSTVQFS